MEPDDASQSEDVPAQHSAKRKAQASGEVAGCSRAQEAAADQSDPDGATASKRPRQADGGAAKGSAPEAVHKEGHGSGAGLHPAGGHAAGIHFVCCTLPALFI